MRKLRWINVLLTSGLVLLAASLTLLVGCSGGGGGSSPVVPAPSNLAYLVNPADYPVGTAITANNPSSGGGAVASYTVSPALPAGLSLNPTTGVITGTPTVVTAQAAYTIKATNAGGFTTVSLSITVSDAAPSNLTYSTNPATYPVGSAITANAPTTSGGTPTSYSVTPALPAGLSLSTTTGVITGSPTAVTAQVTYTVRASNAIGSTTAALSITVANVAPTNLTYATNPATYPVGLAIAANSPTTSGGTPTSYSVTPALPTGLSLNTTTGVITGTPIAVTAQATYTVKATNAIGFATVSLSITVANGAPANLTYATNPATYPVGSAITANVPTTGGGAPTSYSVTPALPAGLSLNTTTGILTGTPTVVTSQATYTVKATNALGFATVGLSITVANAAPANLTYSTNPATYPVGFAITANAPSNIGGTPTSYSVTPGLPTGLSLNTTTGVITGTPSVVTSQASYTVKATNAVGNTTVSLSITVANAAPASLTYSTNPATYPVGSAITANTPANSGGAPTSYSVTPALPTGLSLNTTTGVITGTPSVVTSQATYTVKATNAVGNTTASLSITVANAAPSNLTYSSSTAKYTVGVTIGSNTPTTGGGAPTSYGISPSLPAGLALDTTTGVIAGTPTAPAAQKSYTVTATNAVGNTTASLSIAVYAAPIAEIAAPLQIHPHDSWMEASVPDQSAVPDTYAWSASSALTLNSPTTNATPFFAGTFEGEYSLTANVQNPASAQANGTHNLVSQSCTWLVEDGALPRPTAAATITVLPSGRVLMAGGIGSDNYPTNAAAIYDPATGTWNATGSMTSFRAWHGAALLGDGTVLVCGGQDPDTNYSSSAEIYNPATGTWTAVSQAMTTPRAYFTLTELPDGRALAAGGVTSNASSTPTATAEIYDPVAKTWTATTHDMTVGHRLHTATLVGTKVLVAGGANTAGTAIAQAELFNPADGSWTATPPMNIPHFSASAVLLGSGGVLVAGGEDDHTITTDTQVYNPTMNTWTTGTALPKALETPGLAVLPNGNVLALGGRLISGACSSSAYLASDPVAGSWVATGSLKVARANLGVAVLPNGNVLVAGGFGTYLLSVSGTAVLTHTGPTKPSGALASSEIYSSSAWTGPTQVARQYHTATLLSDNNILVVGGLDSTGAALDSVQLYNPATRAWSNQQSLFTARGWHTATLIGADTVLVAGGMDSSGNPLRAWEVLTYNSTTKTVSLSYGGNMPSPRMFHTATLVNGGTEVLVTGGNNGATQNTSEIYSIANKTWTLLASTMTTARQHHSATLLADGTVLVAGGSDGTAELASSETIDPSVATPAWAATTAQLGYSATMTKARQLHTATLIGSSGAQAAGTVLVAGGADQSLNPLAGSELYRPGYGWFIINAATNPVSSYMVSNPDPRFLCTASPVPVTASPTQVLPYGGVVLAGGYGADGPLATCMIYEVAVDGTTHLPMPGEWFYVQSSYQKAGSNLNAARFGHTATVLPDNSIISLFGNGADLVTEIYVPSN